MIVCTTCYRSINFAKKDRSDMNFMRVALQCNFTRLFFVSYIFCHPSHKHSVLFHVSKPPIFYQPVVDLLPYILGGVPVAALIIAAIWTSVARSR